MGLEMVIYMASTSFSMAVSIFKRERNWITFRKIKYTKKLTYYFMLLLFYFIFLKKKKRHLGKMYPF